MDAVTAVWLGTPEGARALALATQQPDPGSVAAASALRSRFHAELAAAALHQADLRRRAVSKFGERAAALFFTRDGLEQATRPEVAAHHAARFLAAGVRRVVDLGCGIGSDALAFVEAGLDVSCVELDPVTAEIARLNLGDRARVVVGDAERLAPELLTGDAGVFCDPARRNTTRRLWRVEDFSPSWTLVAGLLGSDLVAGVKLGPALPHALIPAGVEAEWVSSRGDTVEVALWSAAAGQPDGRVAMVLPRDRLVVPDVQPVLDTAEPGAYLYEPAGAVIRAGGVTTVGQLVNGSLLDPNLAYLTSDTLVRTPWATPFEVENVLPYQEKVIKRWLREHEVGVLEIKKRGLEVDPAQLRRRLGLRGGEQRTLILTRTPRAALAVVARRLVV